MSGPVGFWSYARSDDAHSDGQLSQLRSIVGKAIALQYGADITIWQDIQAIPPGADWAASIERTISQTVFFIPIVTPRYLKSQHCFAEFHSFRGRMNHLGRDDLIFPILYVGVDQIDADETVFGLELEALRRHQWIDFRTLRHADPRSPEIGTWVDGLAENILKVAVAVSKAEHIAEEASREQQRAAAEEARQREAQAKAAEEARKREAQAKAAEEARQREAAERAAEDARRQRAAAEAASQPGPVDAIAPSAAAAAAATVPATQPGIASALSPAGQPAGAPVRKQRIGVLAASAGGLVVVAGTLATVFLRQESPRPPPSAIAASIPASIPVATPPAPQAPPAPPAPPATAQGDGVAPPQSHGPDLQGSVDQILDSAGLVVSGRIVNLYGIRGMSGRPAKAMQHYLESEGNVIQCFAHGDAYQCFANGKDIAAHAVRLGWARARPGASDPYTADEEEARQARVGIWAQ
ncbi:toll/interleukin-1 receptor domain-containing protein [Paraburkholderia oxyphila]|uniref:toll/interleukin-1 receptor domain-containing protein n=1 Tax=Paraburkholderia oxyphila TaxID=614212 RepID=UPI000484B79F|nr:toll/interleukin-1 receptor domain-containing protein [Paraburkholderia oxyphila]